MTFNTFQFDKRISAGIAACGYTRPTPIQREAIGPIMDGRDMLGLAQTGTGKTAAFVLPLLQRLLAGPRKRLRALIVAPTRELAEQIHENIVRLAEKTGLKSVAVYGGVGKQPQIKAITGGTEIVVACPGRLLDLLKEKGITLSRVEVLILDEADHMFDKGFLPDIRRIVRQVPRKRQTLVFSATMPKEIRTLAEEILTDPVTVQINHTLPAPTISHVLFEVDKQGKTSLLKKMIRERDMKSTLVFTRTKHKARSLAQQLQRAGCQAVSLQGNLSQQKRRQALEGFRDGTFNILVATDIAARGIDVLGISHVINYDVPDTAETYTHRTGRTGRAEKTGYAFTFASMEDGQMISLIERNLGMRMLREEPDPAPGGSCTVLPDNTEKGGKPGRRRARAAAKKKPAPTAPNGKRKRSRACPCDFGINRHR